VRQQASIDESLRPLSTSVISSAIEQDEAMQEAELSEVATVTARERDVLHLMADGHSGKQIARALGIAPCTVERHIENARLKTRTRNRSHLVAYAARNGLLERNA
jgi:DNA-binding CsgD family transcriptional regulator